MNDINKRAGSSVIGAVRDPQNVTQAEIEQFLYADAALLDDWRLVEWMALLPEGARYEIPAIDRPPGDPLYSIQIVSDNLFRIRARAKQLAEGRVLAENPRSRTRRLITNVRILEVKDETIGVAANFAIHRCRDDRMEVFVGSYDHTLVVQNGGLRILVRRAILDMDALRPHGKLSFIL